MWIMQTDGWCSSFSGIWEGKFNTREDIYALPGSDVNLTCQTQKKDFLVQMQWSRVTKEVDLIAVYHPQYGYYCANGVPCRSLVTFTETPQNVSKWILHLKNMSFSLSGKYECSFIWYPEGSQTKTYNLLLQKKGKRNKHVLCASHRPGMVLSIQGWTERGIACKGDQNWSSNSTNKCKIATVIRIAMVCERACTSHQGNCLWESKVSRGLKNVNINTISEVGG